MALIRAQRDMALLVEVENCLRLVRYSPGRIEFEPTQDAAPDLAARLAGRLQGWTGARWGVSVTSKGGAPTLAETRARERTAQESEAMENSLVAAVFQAFPQARIADIRDLTAPDAQIESDALAPAEDELDPDWDPFDDT